MIEPDYDNPDCFQTFHECTELKQWELYRKMRADRDRLLGALKSIRDRGVGAGAAVVTTAETLRKIAAQALSKSTEEESMGLDKVPQS